MIYFKVLGQKLEEPHVLFVADLPHGGLLLECGYCKFEFPYNIEKENCPHCGKDIIFPNADW